MNEMFLLHNNVCY